MTYQTRNNRIVSYKAQSALGTPASGASGFGLRIKKGSPGLRLQKEIIESQTLRGDGQTVRGRHGSRSVAGSHVVEAALGELDLLIAAGLRSTVIPAATRTYDNSAGLTSLTVDSATQITQVGTTTLLGVVSKGDLIKLADMSTAGNNGIWFRVTNVTATVITIAGGATAQGADAACTLTVAKKMVQTNPPVESYWTFDDYGADIDVTRLSSDVKVASIGFSMQPGQPVEFTLGLMGLDQNTTATGSSPVLTSPTFQTSRSLIMADGTIRINGVDYADITSFQGVLDCGGEIPAVLAPNGPDVFLDNAKLSGSLNALRTADTFFTNFDSETQVEFFLHMIEQGDSDPKDFLSLYIGDAVFDGNDLGGNLAEEMTIPWRAGKDLAGNPSDATMIKFCSSAA